MPSVFLSYSHTDRAIAGRVERALEVVPDLDVWRDESSLRPGSIWSSQLAEQIERCDFFVPLLSENYVRPDSYSRKELVHALELLEAGHRGPGWLVPVRISKINEPTTLGALEDMHIVDLFADRKAYHHLLGALRVFGSVANEDPQAKLRLTAHQARFRANERMYYFVNVTNVHQVAVVVTHVHYRDDQESIPIRPRSRPLPSPSLSPGEPWSTFIGLDRIPAEFRDRAYDMFVVRLSTGDTYRSVKESTILPEGSVPGGPILLDGEGLEPSA